MGLTAASIPRSEYVEDGCASVIFKFEQKKLSRSRGGIPNTVQLTAARNESIRTRFRTPTRFPLWRAGLLARMGSNTLLTLTTMRLRCSGLVSNRFYASAARLLDADNCHLAAASSPGYKVVPGRGSDPPCRRVGFLLHRHSRTNLRHASTV
jgi:hypothetical protein